MTVAIKEQLDTIIDRIWAFMREEVYPLEPRLLQEG